MRHVRTAGQQAGTRRWAVAVLGAVMALTPLGAASDSATGVGMSSTGSGSAVTPAWQAGNAQGDGGGR